MTDVEDYKRHISGVFTRASALYDQAGPRFFTHFGKRLVESARISPGARVLDVACGRGAVLFPALKMVGASGEVVGIDISEGMIQEISRDIARRGLANATALKMDAENLELPESSFDTVLCGLVLFFLPNLERALAGFQRVLKPGGWLVASTFQQVEDEASKRWDALDESFKDSLKAAPKAETAKMNSEDEIRQVLSRVGFMEIEVASDQETFYFHDEEEWWQVAWSHGYRAFLERMDTDVLAKYKKEAMDLILHDKTARGIPDTWHLYYSRGKKPS
ncbi:MAG: class I SAM-dependent methyltransferase [Anaerolineales bacterium]|nr:MAG: class I SAM-dependent methyltransferase [Anaerolineales bacterium]